MALLFTLAAPLKKNLTCGVFLTVLQSFWFEYEIHHQQRKWVYSFPLGCEFCHWSRLVVTSATTPSFPCCTRSRKRCRKCVLCADIAFSSDRCARSQTWPDFLLFYEVFPGIWGLFFHCSVVVCGWNLSLSVVCLLWNSVFFKWMSFSLILYRQIKILFILFFFLCLWGFLGSAVGHVVTSLSPYCVLSVEEGIINMLIVTCLLDKRCELYTQCWEMWMKTLITWCIFIIRHENTFMESWHWFNALQACW